MSETKAPNTHYDAVVTSADGVRHTVMLHPAVNVADGPKTTILILPALGVSARHYRALADALATCGFDIMRVDWRATGGSTLTVSPFTPDFGYTELLCADFPAWIGYAKQWRGDQPVVLFGHSLGAQLSAVYVGRHPDQAAGLVIVAAGTVHWRTWPDPWTLLAQTQLVALVASALRYWPGRKLGFGGRQPRGLIRDWARSARTGRYPLPSGEDAGATMGAYRGPVLVIRISDDDYAPESAVADLVDRLSGAEQTRLVFAPADFGAEQVGHFGWSKRSTPVVDAVARWWRSCR